MSAPPDEVMAASASISETVAEMCDALRIMEIKHPDSIPLQRMDAILSAARAKGWQFVPVEPTEEMVEAGALALHEHLRNLLRSKRGRRRIPRWEDEFEESRMLKKQQARLVLDAARAAAPKVEP